MEFENDKGKNGTNNYLVDLIIQNFAVVFHFKTKGY